jgi:hypothetical protein
MTKEEIIELLKPETDLEKIIINDPMFIEGVLYGPVRPGHPEGKILFHIRDIFKNIEDGQYITPDERIKLRIIALFHDTCKFQINRDLPRIGKNNHGYLARKFAENYITDDDILQVIHYHDTAYNIWKRSIKRNKLEDGEKDLIKLIGTINDINLYTWFYMCDNSTGDKTQGDFDWFLKISLQNDKR